MEDQISEKVATNNPSKDSPSDNYEKIPKTIAQDNDSHNKDVPLTLQTKNIHTGSGNVIGKDVIQEFFTCAGVMPTIGGSICTKTNSYAGAMLMLVI